ncbi:MAG: Mur ligase domain-containing protein [Oscillospiraceae bacterium]
MTGYCVSDIAAITGGVLSGDGSAPVTGVVIDSRAVTPGALFAAIPGERVDGHDYIGKAFDLGAACCFAQRVPAGRPARSSVCRIRPPRWKRSHALTVPALPSRSSA